ncbi:MAG: oligoendopeptidase F, partial [Flavobacteriales bacterium]
MLVEKTKRIYLPKDFNISNWDSLEPIYDELLGRNITSFDEFRSWLNDLNELESAMEEEYA